MTEYIHSTVKRTMAYWYVDGLAELCMGVVLILLGVVLLIEGPAPHDSNLAKVMASSRFLVIIGGTFAIGVALRLLKANVTYPRTGYVIYHKPTGKELASGVAAVAALVYLLEFWIEASMPEKGSLFIWLMAGLTLFFAYLFFSWARDTGFRRFLYLGALVILAGLIITGLGLVSGVQGHLRPLLVGPGLFFTFVGAMSIISGALAFGRFLRQTTGGNGEAL